MFIKDKPKMKRGREDEAQQAEGDGMSLEQQEHATGGDRAMDTSARHYRDTKLVKNDLKAIQGIYVPRLLCY